MYFPSFSIRFHRLKEIEK